MKKERRDEVERFCCLFSSAAYLREKRRWSLSDVNIVLVRSPCGTRMMKRTVSDLL